MCFTDMLAHLRAAGITASEQQIRWAIKVGHVSRPKRDGSLRFVFEQKNVAELIEHFRSRKPTEVAT
jgi:hypothetical protein